MKKKTNEILNNLNNGITLVALVITKLVPTA